MLVIDEVGNDDLAKVYIAKINGHKIEFAESLHPPLTINEKWVLIISCLFGCPVKCLMCDAGQKYFGKINKEDIFKQIDHMIERRFPDRIVPVEKFKVQFTRMGEPVFNDAVLEVLDEMPSRYDAPGLMPSVSTIGPKMAADFLDKLKVLKDKHYSGGSFQMQFSIHTTDAKARATLMPVEKMSFEEISEFGDYFFEEGDRKITLNFIVMKDHPIDPKVLAKHFNPKHFIIKLTPLNPTKMVKIGGLQGKLDPNDESSVDNLVAALKKLNFEVIVSIGDQEENKIGSNCGQYVTA